MRLRALVEHGILKTAPASDGSAYQEYLLTPKGRGVFPVLVALRQWSEEFSFAPGACATLLVDRDKGRPVRKLELRAQDGRLLGAGDTELRPNPAAQASPAPLGLNGVSAHPAETARPYESLGLLRSRTCSSASSCDILRRWPSI